MSISCTGNTSAKAWHTCFFNGKELYQGLGSGFWTEKEVFYDKSTWRSSHVVFSGAKKLKQICWFNILGGTAERYLNKEIEAWWLKSPTLAQVMEILHHNDNPSAVNEVADK